MKISQLPEPVKSKALEYQRNAYQRYWNKDTDIVGNAFYWSETTEGYDYWYEWELATEVTPELLKMHYKDAKEVRCLYNDEIYNITSFIEYDEHHNDICAGIKGFDIGNVDYINSYACLYVIETNQLAEIISYKEEVNEKLKEAAEQYNTAIEIISKDGSVNTQPHYDNTSFKEITSSIAKLLEYKNKKYGNSALEPVNIFNGKCKVGQRIDDKISRIKNNKELQKNDVADLMGYLVLACKEFGWSNFDEFMD